MKTTIGQPPANCDCLSPTSFRNHCTTLGCSIGDNPVCTGMVSFTEAFSSNRRGGCTCPDNKPGGSYNLGYDNGYGYFHYADCASFGFNSSDSSDVSNTDCCNFCCNRHDCRPLPPPGATTTIPFPTIPTVPPVLFGLIGTGLFVIISVIVIYRIHRRSGGGGILVGVLATIGTVVSIANIVTCAVTCSGCVLLTDDSICPCLNACTCCDKRPCLMGCQTPWFTLIFSGFSVLLFLLLLLFFVIFVSKCPRAVGAVFLIIRLTVKMNGMIRSAINVNGMMKLAVNVNGKMRFVVKVNLTVNILLANNLLMLLLRLMAILLLMIVMVMVKFTVSSKLKFRRRFEEISIFCKGSYLK